MPTQITTRAQVNGHRFLLRRLQHALVRGDSRMIHDPMRGQMRSMIVGVVIAVLIAGSATVLAFFRPAPNFGSSAIMLSTSDSALYVRIGDRLHPTLNLASARLIVANSDKPSPVDNKFLDTVARGPAVGIIGAPNGFHGGDDLAVSSWSVCDDTTHVTRSAGTSGIETTVLANDPVLTDSIRVARPQDAILTRVDDVTYLIYDGVRAAIDLADPVLASAFGLDVGMVRDVSPGVLNAFPLVDPIQSLAIDRVGATTSYLPAEHPVGTLLRTVDSHGEQLWVVLRDGVQRVSSAAADVVRYSNPESPVSEPVDVSPALISGIPQVSTLPVEHFPETPPTVLDPTTDPVLCMSWRHAASDAEPTTEILIGNHLPLPDDARPVTLATADGSGPGVDGIYLRPGTGEYVKSTGVSGRTQDSGRLFYVSDIGLRFHIPDQSTAGILGVVGVRPPNGDDQMPQPAPWPILSLLPPGPELSQQAALVAHDGMIGEPDGKPITPPNG